MDPLRIYDYLTLARQRVLDKVRALTPEQYAREFPFGLKSIGSTLAHLMTGEWYYIERLQGREVPPYEQWEIQYENPPVFEVIEREWRRQAERTRDAIVAEKDWDRKVKYVSLRDEKGRRYHVTATAWEYFAQLILHEAHHRAQIMVMLREMGHPVQDIDYNDLMFERVVA
jgi:uncharacterized damage-inducible protein DinB